MSTALLVGGHELGSEVHKPTGGREHALAEAIAVGVDTLWYTGENAGIEAIGNARQVPAGANLTRFALDQAVDLAVIGPEKPLMDGLSNQFRSEGLTVFGPSLEAAFITEGSKIKAREFMARHAIASPEWEVIRDARSFESYVFASAEDKVIKADGLAGGKGAELVDSVEEAEAIIGAMLEGTAYDGAGRTGVLIEQRCHGPELSMFVLTDGTNLSILPYTQDHKRRFAGDEGKNTGGMGAYTMIPEQLTSRQEEKLYEIARQTVEGLAEEGTPYKGVIYVGAMLAAEYDGDPVVIEYNARFGDPEAQVLLHLLGEDAFDILKSTDTKLRDDLLTPARLVGQKALTVALVANAYPDGKSVGETIYGLDNSYDGVKVFHGGTRRKGEVITTNGGRVLYVTGHGETIDEAAARAYDAIDPSGIDGGIFFLDMGYRNDIGWQARQAA